MKPMITGRYAWWIAGIAALLLAAAAALDPPDRRTPQQESRIERP